MSFSSDVKNELSQAQAISECCIPAAAYGLLLFGRHFRQDSVSILTEHECVAHSYENAIVSVVGAKAKVTVTDAGKYIVSALSSSGRRKILKFFSQEEGGTLRVNRANLANESSQELNCCTSAFLRGAFLACGTVSDPNKNYHLEFDVPHKKLAEDLVKLTSEINIEAKLSVRRGCYVVYFKESESIEDMLTFMGAPQCSMEFMQIKMMKDLRNKINRRTNFDTANITRTASAAVKQLEAIEYIKKCGAFDSLPEHLKQVASLRSDNFDMSLYDIGQALSPAVSRSGVNHRLSRLIEIAEKLRRQNEEDEETKGEDELGKTE